MLLHLQVTRPEMLACLTSFNDIIITVPRYLLSSFNLFCIERILIWFKRVECKDNIINIHWIILEIFVTSHTGHLMLTW